MIGTLSVLGVSVAVIKFFWRGSSSTPKDIMKDLNEFLEAPIGSFSRREIVKGIISKDFIGTVKTGINGSQQEKYLEAYVRKGKDFTVTLTGISDAVIINKNFGYKLPYEKGDFVPTDSLPSLADMLDGYFLTIVSNGKKAGFLIGANQQGINTAKKVLDGVSAELANGESLENSVTWLKDESDHSEKGSTNQNGLFLVN